MGVGLNPPTGPPVGIGVFVGMGVGVGVGITGCVTITGGVVEGIGGSGKITGTSKLVIVIVIGFIVNPVILVILIMYVPGKRLGKTRVPEEFVTPLELIRPVRVTVAP